MLRRFLDSQLALTEPGKPLAFLRPLIRANDTFLYEVDERTSGPPHIRDGVDVKRWMILVVFALIPALLAGIWNTGIHSLVYSSGDYHLMDQFLAASSSFNGYLNFAVEGGRWLVVLKEGLAIILPLIFITYAVGGFWEALFSCVRGHEISEGFLVTGILYVLILPPTIPYWMAAVGISAGVIFSKELFGGAGMNIVNPALASRAFLFFTFPGRMSGDVWVGSNPTIVRNSLVAMNQNSHKVGLDGYTQASLLSHYNVTQDIKQIHVDAIASQHVPTVVHSELLHQQAARYGELHSSVPALGEMPPAAMQLFVTTPQAEGGLGLSPGYYEDAARLSSLSYGYGPAEDNWSLFFGNKIGCIGETSTFAILLGAVFLIWTGIASWRTMVGMALGALLAAGLLQLIGNWTGADGGAWAPAQFGMAPYKHLLLGGFAFGAVFMATDPVSSPSTKVGKWLFGLFCGSVVIVIRAINPAYPEGVMLAILMGNVCAPLIDTYVARFSRRRRIVHVAT